MDHKAQPLGWCPVCDQGDLSFILIDGLLAACCDECESVFLSPEAVAAVEPADRAILELAEEVVDASPHDVLHSSFHNQRNK